MQQLAVVDAHQLGAPANLQQRVYESLRASLIGGLFAPGESLSLRRIAAANGVSPMPVREAVKRLISEGAIELLVAVVQQRDEVVDARAEERVLEIDPCEAPRGPHHQIA